MEERSEEIIGPVQDHRHRQQEQGMVNHHANRPTPLCERFIGNQAHGDSLCAHFIHGKTHDKESGVSRETKKSKCTRLYVTSVACKISACRMVVTCSIS